MAFIYLASPYTDADPWIRNHRYIEARAITGRLLKAGFHVYSPIVHCHELALRQDLPHDFDFWQAYNFAMLDSASGFGIIKMEGWDKSKGVRAETHQAAIADLTFYEIVNNMLVRQ